MSIGVTCVLSTLAKGCGRHPVPPLNIGDEVYALTGAWREALVDGQEDDAYLLRDEDGFRRWAVAGEVAWHDVSPQPYDLVAGKAVIALDQRHGVFQSAMLLREASSHGAHGSVWMLAERIEQYYEEYVTKLIESARREKEKADKEGANLTRLTAEWRS